MWMRLWLALLAYTVLAVLVWRTMADDKIRLVTWAVLGMFAVRTVLQAARLRREQSEDGQE
jgi:hypothetical protein